MWMDFYHCSGSVWMIGRWWFFFTSKSWWWPFGWILTLFNPRWNKQFAPKNVSLQCYRSVNVSVTWCFKAYFTLKTCFPWCHCPQTWGRRDSQMDAFPSNLQMRPGKNVWLFFGENGNPNFGKPLQLGYTSLCNLGWCAYRWPKRFCFG